jgi:hypothetical protein
MMLGGSNTILYSNRNQPTEVTRVCTDISASRNREVSEHAGINDQGQISLILLTLGSIGALAFTAAPALAYATIEGPPKFSSAPGLPDGRVYE